MAGGNRQTHTYQLDVVPNQTPAERGVQTPPGMVIYETKTQTFYYLTAAEIKVFHAACQWLQTPAGRLMQANQLTSNAQNVTDYTIQKAAFNNILKPLVQGPGQNNLAEIINLNNNCWQYLDRARLSAQKSFCIATEASQALILGSDGAIDINKLLEQLQVPTGVSDEGEIDGSFSSLAKALGIPKTEVGKALCGNPQDPNSILVATDDAQLLRYSSGISLTGNLNPNNPNFGFSSDAHCSLTLGKASINVDCFFPDAQGYDVCFSLNARGQNTSVHLGYMQGKANLSADGFVGASAEASISLECGMSAQGQLMVKGTSKQISTTRGAPANYGMPASADAFVGAKLGGSVTLDFRWANPESSGNFESFASIGAEGDVAAGGGVDASFQVGYQQGEFIVHAEAGLVFGLGLTGGVSVVVYPQHVINFVAFVYHKIMNANYQYMGIITDQAFTILVNLLTKYAIEANTDIASLFKNETQTVVSWWDHFKLPFDMGNPGLGQLLQIANNINSNPDKFKFTPPEVKGRILYILTDPALPQELMNNALQNSASHGNAYMAIANHQMSQIETAILNILSYIQSKHDYENVVTHMSLNPMDKIPETDGEQRLYESLPQNGFTLSRLQQFHFELDNNELVYARQPLRNQPVKPNAVVINIRDNG